MSNPPKRIRQKQLHFYVTDEEAELVKKKMELSGILHMGTYLRKMAIDGYVIKLDLPELRELTSKMKRIANSENQFAKFLIPSPTFPHEKLRRSATDF